MPILSQIFVYPVKSLAGFAVQQWPVDAKGLQYDRKWMLIDDEHRFLSQRRLAKMALISTRIEDGQLRLSAPGQPDFVLPLNSAGEETLAVEIWHDSCQARTVSAAADQWFRQFLQVNCRLVFHPDHEIRPVDPNYAFTGDQTAFSDGFPFLLVSENSLNSLNQSSQLNLSMPRFRPNLVISGCDAYAEDSWRRIRINDIAFRLPKPCSRCAVPGIDPATATSEKAPLVALSQWRKWQNKVYFGQNAIHDHTGLLEVGMTVTVDETGPAQPPLP